MKLREQIYSHHGDNPRDSHQLAMSLILLIPESDIEATAAAQSLWDRLSFGPGPPENHVFYLDIFIEDLAEVYPEDEFESWPWYMKAVALLVSGGSKESDELFGVYQ